MVGLGWLRDRCEISFSRFSVLRSPFSVHRSPCSLRNNHFVLRSPFSVLRSSLSVLSSLRSPFSFETVDESTRDRETTAADSTNGRRGFATTNQRRVPTIDEVRVRLVRVASDDSFPLVDRLSPVSRPFLARFFQTGGNEFSLLRRGFRSHRESCEIVDRCDVESIGRWETNSVCVRVTVGAVIGRSGIVIVVVVLVVIAIE